MLRKDNWSHWEDESITEVMLAYAQQKKTALSAFAYLGEILPNRTASAVAYQWYNRIRAKVFKTEEEEQQQQEQVQDVRLSLDVYVKLLESSNLTKETIELINLRIRSLI